MKIKATLVVAGLAAGIVSQAAPINANNLVIMRVGTGSGTLAATTTAVFLDEYTTSGTLVQSISVSSSGTGALTTSGTGGTEGILSLSGDGTKISFGGYRRDAGLSTTNIAKAAGWVDLAGNVNTGTDISDVVGGIPLRSVTTVDGSSFWLGTSNSVRYVAGSGGTFTSTSIDARNSRQVQIFDNVLWASNGSTAIVDKIQTYGTLPTGATTPTPVYSPGTANAVHGFMALDLDASVAGVDTLYGMDTVSARLVKFSKVGGSWVSNGFLAGTGTLQNLTAIKNGNNVELFATNTTTLNKLVDPTGYNGTLGSTAFSALTTAGANTQFRGISTFKPVPEPGSILALGVGAALLLRRKKA